ncbi:MAG: asparagine synthase (glutamine-hydrolyzing), partial [Candidatus Electrothrix sp. ATG2]|nr:asparagine synthase (glutamine-hydrolyzing) [Candidatus Electrothrix sp. ATG2]
MCGITGVLTRHFDNTSIRSLQQMTDTLRHRGPDDSGIWLDRECGIGLGHRRLAVLDLSPAGHQPMHSASGRYVLVFNGEVYNHLALRTQLEAKQQRAWRGHSDTETLLACFETWGIKESLQRFVGMFAFAVWDRKKRQLTLARDRMGEKPLYYGWCGGGFIFGSELKALRRYPDFSYSISREVLTLYLRYSYIPAPYSIYQGIYKLEPGCLLTVTEVATYGEPGFIPRAPCSDTGWTLQRYWSLQDQVVAGQGLEITDEEDALVALESAVQQSIRLQSQADVPLGAFLSGGIDSSLIAALMQDQATKPIKTFTIGFKEDNYSEAVYAKAVAEHLHTEHTELYLNAEQAMEVIPLL